MPVICRGMSDRIFTPSSKGPPPLMYQLGNELFGQRLSALESADFEMFTVTVTAAMLLPFAFEAVNVYFVVAAGVTTTELAPVTSPMPFSMVTAVALETLHCNVTCCPAEIVVGV